MKYILAVLSLFAGKSFYWLLIYKRWKKNITIIKQKKVKMLVSKISYKQIQIIINLKYRKAKSINTDSKPKIFSPGYINFKP